MWTFVPAVFRKFFKGAAETKAHCSNGYENDMPIPFLTVLTEHYVFRFMVFIFYIFLKLSWPHLFQLIMCFININPCWGKPNHAEFLGWQIKIRKRASNIQGVLFNWCPSKLSKYTIPLYLLALKRNLRSVNIGSCTQKVLGEDQLKRTPCSWKQTQRPFVCLFSNETWSQQPLQTCILMQVWQSFASQQLDALFTISM